MHSSEIKQIAIDLRLQGHTYREISQHLGIVIPKSTLSTWFTDIVLSETALQRISSEFKRGNIKARESAVQANTKKRELYLNSLKLRNQHLQDSIEDCDTAKIALVMLYLGEGSKTKRGGLYLGNSDPRVIKLFLGLLNRCYVIDKTKFRATVQCRADQDIEVLESHWSIVTGIPRTQFYTARIDSRTYGKPSINPNYKGVLRIDYFSAEIFNDIISVIEILT